ncbi:C-C motif chemokine 22 [Molossus molossus]|uniref:C-C motif chemokine n=1 Tax=Molossus molossus TaxID=27622 RepID=A0A7J8C671_MOLMO|nr:C-C motif chemokine 22 [Molossus molossus]KAF6406317.1 C-C motif chemokine ligand 22 [Molossus molossus]
MASLQAPLLAALVLLATALQAAEAGPYGANMEDSICCRSYVQNPLHSRVVRHFYWTSHSCRRPGVVLITLKNWEICADPRLQWVKKILQKLDH